MLTFDDISPRDRFITKSGQVYKVLHVYNSSNWKNPDGYSVELQATSLECQRQRPTYPAGKTMTDYKFVEKDLEWLGELTHEVFTVTQSPERTAYWVSAECFDDDGNRVGRHIYRMGDDICDEGTTNLFTELGEIAAELDRQTYQHVHNDRHLPYNKVVVTIDVDPGQRQIDEYRVNGETVEAA